MVKYGVNIFALIEAKDKEELLNILVKLINAPLPEEVERRIKHMEFDNFVTIHDDEGDVIETIKIMGD